MIHHLTNLLTGAKYKLSSWFERPTGGVILTGFCDEGVMTFGVKACETTVSVACQAGEEAITVLDANGEFCDTLHVNFEEIASPSIEEAVQDIDVESMLTENAKPLLMTAAIAAVAFGSVYLLRDKIFGQREETAQPAPKTTLGAF